MGDGLSYFGSNLTKSVYDGEVPEDRVSEMKKPIFIYINTVVVTVVAYF